jgi:hypothetical protein
MGVAGNAAVTVRIGRKPLLRSARQVRVKAVPLIPSVIDKVKAEAEKGDRRSRPSEAVREVTEVSKPANAVTGGFRR